MVCAKLDEVWYYSKHSQKQLYGLVSYQETLLINCTLYSTYKYFVLTLGSQETGWPWHWTHITFMGKISGVFTFQQQMYIANFLTTIVGVILKHKLWPKNVMHMHVRTHDHLWKVEEKRIYKHYNHEFRWKNFQVVSYSSTLYYYTATFFTKMPQPTEHFFRSLSPFPPVCWALICGSLLGLGGVFFIFHTAYTKESQVGRRAWFPYNLRWKSIFIKNKY